MSNNDSKMKDTKQKHYYLIGGDKFDNMKDACLSKGISSKHFKYLVKIGVISKINF